MSTTKGGECCLLPQISMAMMFQCAGCVWESIRQHSHSASQSFFRGSRLSGGMTASSEVQCERKDSLVSLGPSRKVLSGSLYMVILLADLTNVLCAGELRPSIWLSLRGRTCWMHRIVCEIADQNCLSKTYRNVYLRPVVRSFFWGA